MTIAPEDVNVWVGIDVDEPDHFHTTRGDQGEQLASAALANDETAIRQLVVQAKTFGRPGLVIDQPGSIAALVLAVVARQLEGIGLLVVSPV